MFLKKNVNLLHLMYYKQEFMMIEFLKEWIDGHTLSVEALEQIFGHSKRTRFYSCSILVVTYCSSHFNSKDLHYQFLSYIVCCFEISQNLVRQASKKILLKPDLSLPLLHKQRLMIFLILKQLHKCYYYNILEI